MCVYACMCCWSFVRESCVTCTKALFSFVKRARVSNTWFLGFRLVVLDTTGKLALTSWFRWSW